MTHTILSFKIKKVNAIEIIVILRVCFAKSCFHFFRNVIVGYVFIYTVYTYTKPLEYLQGPPVHYFLAFFQNYFQ